jgi:hypothetical protein
MIEGSPETRPFPRYHGGSLKSKREREQRLEGTEEEGITIFLVSSLKINLFSVSSVVGF